MTRDDLEIILNSEHTVLEAQRTMASVFAAAGLETGGSDARALLKGILGVDGAELIRSPDRLIGGASTMLNDAMRRRLAHEPVTRILGVRGFYGRDFRVTPDVLDPRPDTEAVVELALELARLQGFDKRPIRIAEVGTGSGILIVTLLAELPNASGIATDVSPAALAVAKQNAEAHGVADRVQFSETRGLSGLAGPIDLVVSNPPYIPTSDIAGLEREVRDYDPFIALDGGPEGLDIYRDILNDIRLLGSPALVVFECGYDIVDKVRAVCETAGGTYAGSCPDLNGKLRAVAFEIHL